MSIIIVASVHGELAGLVKKLKQPIVLNIGGRKLISGYIKEKLVRLLFTGSGLVNAVQAMTAVIENLKPSIIIQTGCAGVFKETGMEIGDIGIATEEIDIHLGIESDSNMPVNELPFSLMKHNRYGDIKNRYPVDNQLSDIAFKIIKKIAVSKNFKISKGLFITVSTITATDKKAKEIYKHFAPCMENMEGSGAAHLSLHYDIPFLEIRAASNIVGKRNVNLWNLPLAFERCASAIFAFVSDFDLNWIKE